MTDNNGDVPIMPLAEFVDTVFAELSSHDNKWNQHIEGFGYYDDPACWKDTIIPLVVRLYKLAQTDIAVYWWLLQQMSRVDVCKDGKEFLEKSDLYSCLLNLDSSRSRFILENSLLEHVDELHEALKANNLDAFRSFMHVEDENAIICIICRVLKRVEDVRKIYEKTLSNTEGEALRLLFSLFWRYIVYFYEAYNKDQRSCDGVVTNVLIALYQTQFRWNKGDFCMVADEIGRLWVKSLMLVYFKDKDNMPKSVSELMLNTLQSGDAKEFESLNNALNDCLTEKRKEALAKDIGGWMEMEKYATIWESVFKDKSKKVQSPFSKENVNRKHRLPVMMRNRYCFKTYIESGNGIPLTELISKSLIRSEIDDGQIHGENGGDTKKKVATKKEKPIKISGPKSTINPMPFPDTLDIAPATPKLFLEVLHSKLVSGGYLADDSVNDFVFIFGGGEIDSKGSHHAVDWKEDIKATLQAFCSAFYDMEHLQPRKKPWAKLSKLFTLAGKPISKLSENANEVYGTDSESWMKERIERAIDDAKKKALESPQE